MYKITRIISAALLAVIVLTSAANAQPKKYLHIKKELKPYSEYYSQSISADNFIAVENLSDSKEDYDYGKPVKLLDSYGEFYFDVDIPNAGYYSISADYYVPSVNLENFEIGVKINGEYQIYENRSIYLYTDWTQADEEVRFDSFRGQVSPTPLRVFNWKTQAFNHTQYNLNGGIKFYFEKGINRVNINTYNVAALFGDITIHTDPAIPSYTDYKSQNSANSPDYSLTIEAENMAVRSQSYITGGRMDNYNYSPYDPVWRYINSSSYSWYAPGDYIGYDFEVPSDGIYYITVKYQQGEKYGFPAFKNVYIDGGTPFAELQGYYFHHTGDAPANETLSANGEKAGIFLTKGKHTITLESTADPIFEINETLLELTEQLTNIALEIKIITGNKVDKYRDWGITEYLPNLVQDLNGIADTVNECYEQLYAMAGRQCSFFASLKSAERQLRSFAEKTDTLVNNVDQLNDLSALLSIPNVLEQIMNVDCIYVSGADYDIPEPKLGFLESAYMELQKFIVSFTNPITMEETKEKDKLNVWVARSLSHIETLQSLIEADFTPNTDIEVNISAMPDEQRLLLAMAANNGPDVLLGGTNYRPFDFALRGAMTDLRQFDDFPEVAKQFDSDFFVPFVLDDGVYALPETLNMTVLFYRKDILEALELNVPDTWDDVISMLPALSRYGMNFNTSISSVAGTKHLGVTAPIIQQFGGSLYSEDGTRVELGDPKTMKALKLMTDLFVRYNMPTEIPNFYAGFRNGRTPIGVGDFNTYLLIRYASPELAGLWDIAPLVGMKQENGEVVRYQPTVGSCVFMPSSAENPDNAWEFMKWWVSTDTQTKYAQNLRISFGPQYIWLSANIDSFSQATAMPRTHKEVVLEQFSHAMEIPRNPAYFSVEREISNIWSSVVLNGIPLREATDKAILLSNREIAKKLREFRYIDDEGNLLRPFEMATAEKIDRWKEGLE